MTYFEGIQIIASNVPETLVNFNLQRTPATIPTQASSNFITNKEQGDWAEKLVMKAINESSHNFVAVHYGKNDDLVAGTMVLTLFIKSFNMNLTL